MNINKEIMNNDILKESFIHSDYYHTTTYDVHVAFPSLPNDIVVITWVVPVASSENTE